MWKHFISAFHNGRDVLRDSRVEMLINHYFLPVRRIAGRRFLSSFVDTWEIFCYVLFTFLRRCFGSHATCQRKATVKQIESGGNRSGLLGCALTELDVDEFSDFAAFYAQPSPVASLLSQTEWFSVHLQAIRCG